MSSRLAVPILALVAVPVIAAAALLAAFAHEFVSEDVAPSPGRVIEGSVWIVTGLIAWWRVPGNRIGPLATAFGFVDIAGLLYWDAALPFSLAPIVAAFIFAIGVHLFLAFPTGRLQTRTDRAVVAFAYVATVILAPAGAMFRETLPGCADCPTNLLFVADIPALAAAIDVVATLLAVGLLLVTIALVIRHWRGASPESRLALDPVLAVSGLATVSLLATVVAQGLGLDGAVACELGALDACSSSFRSRSWPACCGSDSIERVRPTSKSSVSRRSCAPSWSRFAPRARASSRPAMPSDVDSSATCTTAPSSACWAFAWPCGRPGCVSPMAVPTASTSSWRRPTPR